MITITPLHDKGTSQFENRRMLRLSRSRPKFNTQMRKDFHAAYRRSMGDRYDNDLYFMRHREYEYAHSKARHAWNLWRMATDEQRLVTENVMRDNAELIRTQIELEMELAELKAKIMAPKVKKVKVPA